MVVMESNICGGMAVGTSTRSNLTADSNQQPSPPPSSNRWYDHMAQSAAAFQQFGGGGGNNGLHSSEAELADAYFKCNNAAAASTYFSQMQGAYGGMAASHTSQHGKTLCNCG